MLMEPASFEEIAKEIGTTTERARQIYKEAMEKIKRRLEKNPELAKVLAKYLDSRRQNLQCPKIPEGTIREFDY